MKTKLKTRKAVSKRFIVKKSHIVRKKAYRGHLMRHKTTRQLRQLNAPAKVHSSDESRIALMLPYS